MLAELAIYMSCLILVLLQHYSEA